MKKKNGEIEIFEFFIKSLGMKTLLIMLEDPKMVGQDESVKDDENYKRLMEKAPRFLECLGPMIDSMSCFCEKTVEDYMVTLLADFAEAIHKK